MDIYEFELRYLAYNGFCDKTGITLSKAEILDLVKRTDKGVLQKALTQTTPDELKELTLQTYTGIKKNFIKKYENTDFKNYKISDYINRLEYELKVIKEMGFNTYFLIVQEYINWAKENKIAVGPGRGSAAGSVLSYYIGITDLDPMEYDLLFERFLNPARISMPDIDTDFEDLKREQVVHHIKEVYGYDKVAYIGTYMKMAAKAAFKDVARVLGMVFEQANSISALINEKTIQKSLDANEELRGLYESDDNIKKIINFAIKLEGTVRQTGVHACGMIIAPTPVVNYTPIFYPPKGGGKSIRDEGRLVTQYDGHYMEDVGILKMDFLGLRNLTIIKDTIKIVKARYEKDNKPLPDYFVRFLETMGFYPPMNDKYTFESIFQSGDTSGVFQFESDGMKKWLIALKPTDINDLIAMVSLYRPGPMEFIPSYINRKSGKEKISYMNDELANTLREKYGQQTVDEESEKLTQDLSSFMDITFGIPIYQEQLMRIVQAMAGFSLGEADVLRRGVGKKIKEVVEKIKKEFVEKAEKYRGYKPETSTNIYEKMIEPAANYSFNKSHAACYAFISYQTAYLKAYYKIEFNTALLRSVEQESDKFSKFINELKMMGISVLPPNINESYKHCAAIDDTIRIGLVAIKGIGYEVGQYIQDEREKNGRYQDLHDFLKRCTPVVNKKSIESLAKAGALDEFEDRQTILANINQVLDFAKTSANSNSSAGLFDFGAIAPQINFKERFKTPVLQKLLYEYEVFKTFISAHPFDGLYGFIKSKFNLISMFKDKDDFGPVNFIGFVKEIRKTKTKGSFLTIEDISGEVDIYLKEYLDIKEFDIVIVGGYKSKSLRVKRISVVDLEDFIDKVKKSGKYNPDETVLVVRAKRLGRFASNKPEVFCESENIELPQENIATDLPGEADEIQQKQEIETDLQDMEEQEELLSEQKESEEETAVQNYFLPDDVSKINLICNILKDKKGDKKFILNGKEYLLAQDGIDEILDLLK